MTGMFFRKDVSEKLSFPYSLTSLLYSSKGLITLLS